MKYKDKISIEIVNIDNSINALVKGIETTSFSPQEVINSLRVIQTRVAKINNYIEIQT